MVDFNFRAIEKKWQEKWDKAKAFEVKEGKEKKYYVLEMFPYPSGSGLHMGHAFNYTIGDIYARFKRMNGFNVLYPMGYDSLGLPAENAAIKVGEHPRKFTDSSINNFIKQQKALGLSYDWNRLVKTCDSDYYKWNQYFFLKFLEKGLVYRKKAYVNWCPKCNTVLANEQVHSGKCWRHEDTDVEIKQLEQWFVKITNYADELLGKVELLNWPERIRLMQKNWIGKSSGTEIEFEINREKWPIFTTRPDTIYGVTFMVISAQHPDLMKLVTKEQEDNVKKFLKKIKTVSQKSMKEIEELEKEGVFTGSYAVNPMNKEKVPVYAGNFVLADYGSGMVMAVPAHDERDFKFAEKYKIPIKIVIQNGLNEKIMQHAFTEEGTLVNSGQFNGMKSKKAIEEITKYLQSKKLGKKTVNYKLRDWLISRQRYWGTPIPIIYCEKCGVVSVPEKDLPVKLPEKVKFGKGNPLETAKDWIKVKCPKCKGIGRRETDTIDTFFDSSWYFLRYCDSKNNKRPFEKKNIEYWMPVDQYIGGAEHACMHLIYARFFTKVLRDLGFLKFDEPFNKLFNQGMLHGEDGYVMSKSRGNVVLPGEVSREYGIDTARLFLVSIASPDKDIEWSENGIDGIFRLISKIIDYFENIKIGKSDERIESKLNKAIKEISGDIESFRYNLAIIKLRQLFEKIEEEKEVNQKDAEAFLKLLSPFCPHIAEELWSKLGNKSFISLEKWPVVDEKKIDLKLEKQEEQVEKLAEDVNNILKILKSKGKNVEGCYIYVIPSEKEIYENGKELIRKKTNLSINIFAVNDKNKYDPTGKSKNSKPGKPAIYLEQE